MLGTFMLSTALIMKMVKGIKLRKSRGRSTGVIPRVVIVTLYYSIVTAMMLLFTVLPLFDMKVSPSIERRLLMFVCPICACLNPIMNTFSTAMFMKSVQ